MLIYSKINKMANSPKAKTPKSKTPKSGKKSGHKRSGHKRSAHKKSGHKRSGHKKSAHKGSAHKGSKELIARCLPENKDVKIQNPTIRRNKKNGCKYAVGKCPSCGRGVSRILPKDH